MRFYNGTHQHWCGIDLHAKTMYVCILDHEDQVLAHRNLRTSRARLPGRDRALPQGPGGGGRVHLHLGGSTLLAEHLKGDRAPEHVFELAEIPTLNDEWSEQDYEEDA